MPNISWALTVLAAFPTFAGAEGFKIGDILVTDLTIFETAATAQTGAGYFAVTNDGANADRLIAVEADFPRVMMHDSQISDGVATMVHLEAVDLQPGETVVFEPGHRHVMFMGLAGDPLEKGEAVDATLVFENAGKLDVQFDVIQRP